VNHSRASREKFTTRTDTNPDPSFGAGDRIGKNLLRGSTLTPLGVANYDKFTLLNQHRGPHCAAKKVKMIGFETPNAIALDRPNQLSSSDVGQSS
jgi:hypothetical protein